MRKNAAGPRFFVAPGGGKTADAVQERFLPFLPCRAETVLWALFLGAGLAAWRAAREALVFCATAETLLLPLFAPVVTAALLPDVLCAEATLLAVLPDFW